MYYRDHTCPRQQGSWSSLLSVLASKFQDKLLVFEHMPLAGEESSTLPCRSVLMSLPGLSVGRTPERPRKPLLRNWPVYTGRVCQFCLSWCLKFRSQQGLAAFTHYNGKNICRKPHTFIVASRSVYGYGTDAPVHPIRPSPWWKEWLVQTHTLAMDGDDDHWGRKGLERRTGGGFGTWTCCKLKGGMRGAFRSSFITIITDFAHSALPMFNFNNSFSQEPDVLVHLREQAQRQVHWPGGGLYEHKDSPFPRHSWQLSKHAHQRSNTH